jgi:hypothetical protein
MGAIAPEGLAGIDGGTGREAWQSLTMRYIRRRVKDCLALSERLV